MTSARLLVVRHGRTEGTRSRVLRCGNASLDAVGAAQARTIAEVLGRDPLDRIFCSPLQQALGTAAPLARAAGLTTQVRPALREMDCGSWEGSLEQAVESRVGDRDPDLPLPGGGESVAQARERLSVFREWVGLDDLPGTSVVVGHYLTSQLLVGMLLGEDAGESLRSPLYRPAPGSVAELSRTAAGWRMHAFRITALTGAL